MSEPLRAPRVRPQEPEGAGSDGASVPEQSGGTGRPGQSGGTPRPTEPSSTTRRDREGPYRRAVRVGLAISLLVHLFLIFVVSREFTIDALPYGPAERPVRLFEGLQVIDPETASGDITAEPPAEVPPVVEEPPAEIPAEAPAEAAPERAGAPEPAEVPEGAPAEGAGAVVTNAEKIRLKEGDARLWEEFEGRIVFNRRVLFSERGEAALRARLGLLLDSLRLSEEQRREATEWLVGEGDQSWGITPEGIVLGGTTIPISLGQLFGLEGPEGREARREARDLQAIRQQDIRQDAERIRRERAEAMRERTAEEVRERADTTGRAGEAGEEGEARQDTTEVGDAGSRVPR